MTSSVDKAKALIFGASLTPPEHKILYQYFVDNSYSAEVAADEVIARVEANPDIPIEDVLRSTKADWHSIITQALALDKVDDRLTAMVVERDHGRCLFTRKDTPQIHEPLASHIISPSVSRILSRSPDDSENRLLRAFLAPENATALRKALDTAQATTDNALLVSPDIANAFWGGKLFINLYSRDPPPSRYNEVGLGTASKLCYVLRIWFGSENLQGTDGMPISTASLPHDLETSSPTRLPLPSLFLLGLQQNLSLTRRQFSIEAQTKEPWPADETPKFWSRRWLLFFRKMWHIVPKRLRVWTYHKLLGNRTLYHVEELFACSSFGLILKHDKANEGASLQLLETEAPTVPVPLLVDSFQDSKGRRYVVMTKLPGRNAHGVFYRMSYPERHQLADDVASALERIRRIPNRDGMFCGPDGGKLHDMYAGYQACGPFATDQDYHNSMAGGHLKWLQYKYPKAFTRPHAAVFTHGDLYPGNIMVDAGKFSGLIDWERSGFYPEYWENCKAVRGAFDVPEIESLWQHIWKDDYKEEVKMADEWMNMNPWGSPEMEHNNGVDVCRCGQ